ncbi:MAG: DUF4838 domain-containing protein [Pirellulales bacterium]
MMLPRSRAAHGTGRVLGIGLLAATLGLIQTSSLPAAEAQPKASAGQLVLAEAGQSAYRIVVAADASASVKHAAEELQTFLKEISGAQLPIVADTEPLGEKEIILGDNAHLKALGTSIDLAKLGLEGYCLRTVGSRLVIAGGAKRGALYGVYGLLEDKLGCRWFTPTASRIPKQSRLAIGPLDETVVPPLEYREPYVVDCFDGDWCARNRMNSNAGRLGEKHGGKVSYFGFVHTFNGLVPPEKYFAEHPEYFSEIDGKRLKDQSQLCCTNEDVIRIVTEETRRRMREHPEAFVFSISQNDWYNFCKCPKCAALAEREGSQIAPVLFMVNRVAEAVEKEFPDKAIDTLAYQWTRKAPKSMRPRPNVIVRLCSIECCFSHPLATCNSPENVAFRADAEAWAKVCDRLWVWDYTTSFAAFFYPFPNLRVLDDNIRFFQKNHVRGIFEEDNYISPNGELSALGGYMMAKFLWNPNYDENVAMNEFLAGVYGPAAGPIRQYIDLVHDKVEKENLHMHIWERPGAAYLTDDVLDAADKLWAEAEAAAAGDSEILRRVKAERLSVDFALVNRALAKAKPGAPVAPETAAIVARFFAVAGQLGVTTLNEGGMQVSAFRKTVEEKMGSKTH